MDLTILDRLLATVAVATNNVKARHWTLTGEKYRSWHLQLDEIYEDLADAMDNIAELIVQRGGIPVHSLQGFLETSIIEDMQGLGDWRRYIEDTNKELKFIIDFINEHDAEGVWDGAASNDLTGIASKLYHWYMFTNQSLK